MLGFVLFFRLFVFTSISFYVCMVGRILIKETEFLRSSNFMDAFNLIFIITVHISVPSVLSMKVVRVSFAGRDSKKGNTERIQMRAPLT